MKTQFDILIDSYLENKVGIVSSFLEQDLEDWMDEQDGLEDYRGLGGEKTQN